VLVGAAIGVGLAGVISRSRRRVGHPVAKQSRSARNIELARLGLRIGATTATANARKLFADAERRIQLDEELKLRSAEQIAERLGQMKGAVMKIGQMASYLDDGMPEPMRAALATLQTNAPPMSADLAATVIRDELGADPSELFVQWDPEPIASASIGQVHRAVYADPATGEERAVAVKVQYPGVGEAIAADLRNTDLLGAVLAQGFAGLDPTEMVAEIKERLTEELDYCRERDNQRLFADFYRGHPFIHVPDVVPELCTGRVLTTE
jgi:predicted unusual protein kinase regulating ubiquinone biosynthesis (AarF/ABC1/UbiB family)